METIRTYTNTKCELEMAKTRLSLLMDKKEQLYCKYFPVTQKLKDDIVKGGEKDNDKMAKYVHELNEVDIGTGRSLAQEIEYQRAIVDKLVDYELCAEGSDSCAHAVGHHHKETLCRRTNLLVSLIVDIE